MTSRDKRLVLACYITCDTALITGPTNSGYVEIMTTRNKV